MDNNKTIRFTTLVDTRQFDEAIKRMSNEINNLQNKFGDKFNMGSMYAVRSLGGTRDIFTDRFYGAGSASYGAIATNRQIIREELEQRTKIVNAVKEEMKALEAIRKNILSMIELKKSLNKESKEYKQILESITKETEKLNMKEAEIRGLQGMARRPGYGADSTWHTLLSRGAEGYAAAAAGGGGRFGGIGGFFRGIGGGIYDMMRYNPLQFYGGLAAFSGSALMTGAILNREFAAMPREIVGATGAARALGARPTLSALSGNVYEELLNIDKLDLASRMAKEEVKKGRTSDLLFGMGSGFLGAAGGFATAAGFAKAAGIALGGPLALAAAGIGAGVGLFANRDNILGYLGIGDYGKKYEARKQAEEMQKRIEVYESLKQSDPYYQFTIGAYRQFQLENLPLQRALGLTDEQISGYLARGNIGGFTNDMLRRSMFEIAQAGGSTSAARSLGLNANLLQRNIGLLNANQMYGNLSYLMGGDAGKTEQAMKEFLASAFKMGLDKSEYRQEMNRYTEALTNLINRTGIYTPEGIRSISESFRATIGFGGEISARTINTGLRVMEGMEQYSVAGGSSQVLRLAGYMRDPVLRRLGFQTLSIVDKFTIEELKAGKADAFLSPEQVDRLIQAKQSQYTGFASMDEALRRLHPEVAAGRRPTRMSEEEYREQQGLLATVLQGGLAMGDPAAMEAIKDPVARQQYILRLRQMQGLTKVGPGLTTEALEEKMKGAFAEDAIPTGGDRQISLQAKMEEVMKNNFTRFGQQLDVSAEQLSKFAKAVEDAILRVEAAKAATGYGLGPKTPTNLTPRTK